MFHDQADQLVCLQMRLDPYFHFVLNTVAIGASLLQFLFFAQFFLPVDSHEHHFQNDGHRKQIIRLNPRTNKSHFEAMKGTWKIFIPVAIGIFR